MKEIRTWYLQYLQYFRDYMCIMYHELGYGIMCRSVRPLLHNGWSICAPTAKQLKYVSFPKASDPPDARFCVFFMGTVAWNYVVVRGYCCNGCLSA